MVNIIIASSEENKARVWLDALKPLYNTLSFYNNIEKMWSDTQTKEDILLVLDVSLLTEKFHLSLVCHHFFKVMIVDDNSTPAQRIQFIYQGAWGYSDFSINPQLIVHAIKSILNNEVWMERQLVPQLLEGVVAKSDLLKDAEEFSSEIFKSFLVLTRREIEVIKLVYSGEDNASIAQALNISPRTVKAHLSAVYRKLNVVDRFHLIIFLKNVHIEYLSHEHGVFEVNEQLIQNDLPL